MPPPFSTRTAWDLAESAFAQSIRLARSAGCSLLDLTVSNPTACGLHYDADQILSPLSNPRGLAYDPDPRGILSARESVAAYYASHGATVDPNAITLTTSTSEAYAYLFRLLCNADDELLVPQPSYPLFDFLATLEDVRLRPYPLFYDHGWWIDFTELERSITPRTRAILIVHPNNPTGHVTSSSERLRLEDLCARHNLALVVDEVFLDYPHNLSEVSFRAQAQRTEAEEPLHFARTATSLHSFAKSPHPALTFVLSGLSKIAALPQMKVGWIASFGPQSDEALARLEVIADTFLSLNTPAQLALPTWLASCHIIQQQILERIRVNLTSIASSGLESLHTDGGWSAILRLPRIGFGAIELLNQADVITHPGDFYGIAEPGRVVISLITPPDDFSTGLNRIAKLLI